MSVKNHYNQASKIQNINRDIGPSILLKKFHNEIKNFLIFKFAFKSKFHLDIACGRGGDLHKWKFNYIENVIGIDISEESIKEAKKRNFNPNYNFYCINDIGINMINWKDYSNEQFTSVSIMFALNYFFDKQESLENLFQNIISNLKIGGFVFGTVSDGKICNNLLQNDDIYENKYLKMEKKWTGTPTNFESGYKFSLKDTITSNGPVEYLVNNQVLISVAKQFNLHPITNYDDIKYFDPVDKDSFFKHFHPNFNNPDLEIASKIYSTFVFEKK